MRHSIALVFLIAVSAHPARAAESFDNCSGYIDSVPATITTQGVWCLRADLSTTLASGNAISIATNNVTIDCNDYKLGGLGAGVGTAAVGISASSRLNVTVRNCNVRGFVFGVRLTGGGHLIEDNRFEANTQIGVQVAGDGNVIRRNLVVDTGGSSANGLGLGINSDSGRVIVQDNLIDGVVPAAGQQVAAGIWIFGGSYSLVKDNFVTGLDAGGAGFNAGIWTSSSTNAVVRGNTIAYPGTGNSNEVVGQTGVVRCRDNVTIGMTNGIPNCTDLGGNSHTP